jgi:trafficking protein particle complex subunit 10
VDLIRDENDAASAPERRHQIPGLRQTPYLKIYLLRCDDNETYKATCRKQIREWVKNNAQQAENKKSPNSQENHDAFEWLIVHVIPPETAIGSQSRTSKEARLGTTDSSDSITTKSKWPGKGSSVLERLRADVNGSSKSTSDHVAQIRIPNAEQQMSTDLDDQFYDLVEKLKITILASFDLRVRQYEEDIREKDSQRSLPGWNFNTFFILKEGLARGFENVGLFDDALAGYDELALGLDVIVYEQLEGTRPDNGGRFLHFSNELKDKIEACLKDTDEGTESNSYVRFESDSDPAGRLQRRDYPLDSSKIPFRELILANDISLFDFRLYIFSRQLDLLLRSANALSIADQPSGPQSGSSKFEEHFLPLAKACHRAIDFITNEARTLRHDLELALKTEEPTSADERSFRSLVISNFIASWMYVSSLQILAQTGSPSLTLPAIEAMAAQMTVTDSGPRTHSPSKDMLGHSIWSLSRTPSPTGMKVIGRAPWSGNSLGRVSIKSTNKTGTEELAGARAELYLLARAAIQKISNQRGWTSRWSLISPANMQDVSLETNRNPHSEPVEERARPAINGLQYLDLRNAFHSEKSFKSLFVCLTEYSYRHSLAANRTKSAEKAIAELAILKYEDGDYEEAASYLGRIASFYSDGQWTALEATFLELYARCMKKLGRHGEYVTSLLRLLGHTGRSQQIHSKSSIDRYLGDLWSYSEKLTTSVSARLNEFFSVKGVTPYIHHYQDRDGFFIPLEISFIGGGVEAIEGVQMTLSSIYDSSMPILSLHSQPVKIGRSSIRIELCSNLSISGWYGIETLQIQAGNIYFVEDHKATSSALVDQPKIKSYGSLRFFIYPPARSLQATASPAPFLHLAQPRSILVEMKTGWNEIQACTLTMRSGTAGLRLHLHEAKGGSENVLERLSWAGNREGTQAVTLTKCSADSDYRLLVPYTVENADVPVINAKLDVEYTTAKGNFKYSNLVAVNTILPLSVNVQDIFQEKALLSRFTISPATLVPIRLWKCDMQNSEDTYNIDSHMDIQDVMDVFPKQPASLLYKFARRKPAILSKNSENSLALNVQFSCLDEVVLKAIEKHFIESVLRSPVANLAQPLCAHLLSTFRSEWSAQDLEVIGLCNEMEIWPFEDLGWDTILKGVNAKTRGLASAWLREWHRDNTTIPIYENRNDEAESSSRTIVIPVDIPTPKIVVTVALETDDRRTGPLMVGDVLLANLYISHTGDWAASETSAAEETLLEISFEVLAPHENWVIGGLRKGCFAADGKLQSMPVILLPQRTGHLLLPSIEVKCHIAETVKNGVMPKEGSRVSCEVDMKSLAQSVQVVSGLRETVVEIATDAENGQPISEKRSWLAGSKGRKLPSTLHKP